MANLSPVLEAQLNNTYSIGDDFLVNFGQYRQLLQWLKGLSTGGGGGQVNTLVAGDGILVDATDPVNPVVSVSASPLYFNFSSGVMSFVGDTDSINNVSAVPGVHITDALESLQAQITGNTLEQVLTAGNVANAPLSAIFTGASFTTTISNGSVVVDGNMTLIEISPGTLDGIRFSQSGPGPQSALLKPDHFSMNDTATTSSWDMTAGAISMINASLSTLVMSATAVTVSDGAFASTINNNGTATFDLSVTTTDLTVLNILGKVGQDLTIQQDNGQNLLLNSANTGTLQLGAAAVITGTNFDMAGAGGDTFHLDSTNLVFTDGGSIGVSTIDNTGLFSSYNGANMLAEFMYNHISLSSFGNTRVFINSGGGATFSDGVLSNVTIDGPSSTISLTDGGNFAILTQSVFSMNSQMRITGTTIDDNGGGSGLDFSATTGIIKLPTQGFEFIDPSDYIKENSAGIEIGYKSGAKFNVTDGTGNGVYSIEGNAGFSGSGVFTNFTVQGGIITNAS